MPIKGKITAVHAAMIFKAIPVGTTAYLDTYEIELTSKALFVECFCPVYQLEDLEDDEIDCYVKVTRIGSGLTEDDFELDFSALDPEDDSLVMLPHIVFKENMREKDAYVIFSNPDVIIVEDGDKRARKEMTDAEYLEHLEESLVLATANQEFEEAIELKAKIDRQKRKMERENK